MATYRALVLKSTSEPLSLDVRPIPTAVPGSVIVKVLGLSVIPYMAAVLDGSLPYAISMPMVPGSSCLARIHSIGPDAISLTPGQLVYCDMTVRARDDPNAAILMGLHGGAAPKLMDGEWRDGPYAEYAKFPTENVFPLNEEVLLGKFGYSIEDLCALPNLLVPFGGLSEIDVRPGDTVIVAPATGKFGGSAVTTALAMGASVVACGRNASTLETMSSFFSSTGRLSTVVLTGDIAIDTKAMVSASGNNGKGADAFIDFSPAVAKGASHINAALGALRQKGRAAFMGGIMGGVEIDYSMVMMKSLRIQGRFMYEREMIVRLLGMVEKGNLKLGEEGTNFKTVGKFGLDSIGKAVQEASKATGWGSQVVLLP
ncbi:isopropanol dehydrogenase [Hyaloscypha finlandica]|nr:isopropanol dehydrogenase [Hyaloscypha sp. PMI_1271]KAH8780660.1 isopropanol dehydrogenase [Hyaloscypha finlandica]